MIPSINAGSSKAAVIARLTKFPSELNNASKKLRADIDVVKISVEKDGSMIRYASKELRNDVELAKIAVSNNGMALQHCLKEPLLNKEVLVLAITQNVKAIKYITDITQPLLRLALELNAEDVMH